MVVLLGKKGKQSQEELRKRGGWKEEKSVESSNLMLITFVYLFVSWPYRRRRRE